MSARAALIQRQIAELSAELMAELQAGEQPEGPPPPWLSIDGFAERIGVHPNTVRRMIADKMPHERVRKRIIRIPVAKAEAWIREQSARLAAERAASLDEHAGGMR